MKTRAILVFLISVAATTVALPAQAALDLAVVAGPSFANQNILGVNAGGAATVTSTSNETYGAGGPWCNLVFPDSTLGISGGLLFAETGAKTQSSLFGASASYDVRTPWLQLPVMLGFWPPLGNWTGALGLSVGAYLGIPVGQTESVGTSGAGTALLNYSNANVDVGVAAGAQIKVPVGVLTFLELNVLYEGGLVNVDTNGNNIRNSTLLVMAGVGLSF